MIHLHTHSMYSLRDSIIKPSELAERLTELGQDTVAITDHGGSLGGVTIYKTLREHSIRYIHGVEFYICDDVSVKEKGSKYYHLIALCKNDEGRINMNRLITISEHPDNKYYKPRIDFGILQEHKDGLVIMSACMAGEVSQALMDGDREQAKRIAQKYREVFGQDYYLEIQSHRTEDQEKLNVAIISLAKELDIPFVVTCDAHYVKESDAKYQSKYAFNGAYKEDGETYLDCFIQSEDEVRQKLWYLDSADIEQAIAETHRIADKCRLEMPLSDPIMPKIDTPGNFESNKQWLHWLCADGFRTKLRVDLESGQSLEDCTLTTETIKTYVSRYKYEMDALEKMGFIDYILLVYSYSNVGKRRGIARGSGGGSLINYLTNITNIDPIEHGLYFERFIDVGALPKLESGEITAKELKVPDIDLDFSGESCKEVLHFLYDTYGEERVASIGKFGTNKTKGTIRDMARVFGIDLQTADQIAKSFESYEIDEIDAMISGGMETSFGAVDAIRYVKNYPELFEYVRKLNGLPKSFGLHACGRVISTRDLDDFLPSCYDSDGIRYLQGDMHDVEDVGLVKIDVLGLRTLDQEYDTLEMSGETVDFIDPRQSYDDPKVLDVFRKKDTLGIFQMSSYGMKQTLAQMQVSGIDDLSVANALYRPGSMGYIDNYCRRKAGKESFEYLHPDLEPILKSTYGIIVFQEQLIEIGRMAGLHNPDLLRKATGKKNPQLLAEIKPELESKLKDRGWNQEQFDQLWSDMLEFAKYSFNKCVSGKTKLLRPGIKNCVWHPTVEEMYLVRNDIGFAKESEKLPLRSKYRRYGYGSALSMFDDGKIHKNIIVDIRQSGVRKTITLRTESGAEITCTLNHKFPTPSGIKLAEELCIGSELYIIGEYEKTKTKYNFTDGNFENNFPTRGQCGFQSNPNGPSAIFKEKREWHKKHRSPCSLCGKEYSAEKRFELHHKNGCRSDNSDGNLCWCCNSCHKKSQYSLGRTKVFEKGLPVKTERIVSIAENQPEMTYDITMADPAHNFVVDSGIVTCNSHAAAYAIIAYMTAKQKAYYPAEFFAGLCNSYIGHSAFVKDDADEILSDAARHGVLVAPFNFRDDHRKCSIRDGRIVWAIPLIRDCNTMMAEALYEHRNTAEQKFWRLAKQLDHAGIKSAGLTILVQLGFFSEYGDTRKLLRVLEVATKFKFGDRVSVKKAGLSPGEPMTKIVEKYSTDRNAKGEELKTYRLTDCTAIIDECEDYIRSFPESDIDFKSRIAYQKEMLGFVSLLTGKTEDRPKLFVKNISPVKRKRDNKQFGYGVITQSIGSGIETRFTIFNRVFDKEPITEGDVILCKGYERDGQYFTMTAYEKIFF